MNNPEESYYPLANLDGEGNQLDGAKHHHVLRLTKGDIPPAKCFWSVTMYDTKERLLVETPINRYSIGDRTPGLKYGTDGSLTIYLQRDSPGSDKESNWLPAPEEPFYRKPPVLTPSLYFRHLISGLLALVSMNLT